jgi:hypothetical protein
MCNLDSAAAEQKTAQGRQTLGASVAHDTTDIKQTVKRQTKCQPFAKLKELQCNRTSLPKLQHI